MKEKILKTLRLARIAVAISGIIDVLTTEGQDFYQGAALMFLIAVIIEATESLLRKKRTVLCTFAVDLNRVWHEFPELENKPTVEFCTKFLKAVEILQRSGLNDVEIKLIEQKSDI